MKLYLMRHGHAVSAEADRDRPLSDVGLKQASSMAEKFKDRKVKFDLMVHSTKLRAKQTAEIVSEMMDENAALEVWQNLCPVDPVDVCFDKIQARVCQDPNDQMLIVGHLPFLPKLAHELNALNPIDMSFPEAACGVFQTNSSGWEFIEIMTPS